jgi:nucleosome binding factor SPN SPT16 subunit
MKDFMDKVHMIKIKPEIDNLKVASNFVKWTFDNIVNEVEDIIDAEKPVKHQHIQKKVESLLDKQDAVSKFLGKNPGVKSDFLEYPLPILIQSGETFTLNKF